MTETPRLARDMLQNFVDRIERLNEERKAFSDDVSDIYKEAKANGFDAKALKIVIQRRAKGHDEIAELDALVETYESQLGTPVASRAPARDAAPVMKPVATAAAKVVAGLDLDIPPELDLRRAAARM